MKKCTCGHDTFKEYSREDCCQSGVRINDDGSHDYDDAGTIEPCGNGVSILYLECEECGKVYSEQETPEDGTSDDVPEHKAVEDARDKRNPKYKIINVLTGGEVDPVELIEDLIKRDKLFRLPLLFSGVIATSGEFADLKIVKSED